MVLKAIEGKEITNYHNKMYKDYIKELKSILKEPYFIIEAERNLNNIIDGINHKENTIWFDIDNGKGFILLGFGDNCHPSCDYYIEEIYVAPEYRRKGLMEKSLRELLDKNKGVYSLYIVEANTPALSLWNKKLKF